MLSLSPTDVAFKNQEALGSKGLNSRVLFFTIVIHIKGCLIFFHSSLSKQKQRSGPSHKLANPGFLHGHVQSWSSWGCPRDLISTELTPVSPSVNAIIRNSLLFNSFFFFSQQLISLFNNSNSWQVGALLGRRPGQNQTGNTCPSSTVLRNQTELRIWKLWRKQTDWYQGSAAEQNRNLLFSSSPATPQPPDEQQQRSPPREKRAAHSLVRTKPKS